MWIAIGIVSLFRGGGLQRDCLTVAELLRARGHDVDLYAASSDPELSSYPGLRLLPSTAWSNHARDSAFGRAFAAAVRRDRQVVVGFNKLPGLDVLYCADPCLAARRLSIVQRWLPRARARKHLEAHCFAEPGHTQLALLTSAAAASYAEAWSTSADRITVLPPTIAPGRQRPCLRDPPTRARLRASLGEAANQQTWLWIGSQPHIKGLDRVLTVLQHHDDVRLLAVGATGQKIERYRRLATELGVAERVRWLGYRDDIPELMAMSDVMVHPARLETTGQALLEALANGLPVVATDVCGFADMIGEAGAGIVLPSPFSDDALNTALRNARSARQRAQWSENAVAYTRSRDLGAGLERFADLVERVGRAKQGRAP